MNLDSLIFRFTLPFLVSFLCSFQAFAQIELENPSFEGNPQDDSTPSGWIGCSNETTPDILPGYWGVFQKPSDGDSYLGLIAREDGTWESVGQRLKEPLKAFECYSFSLDLALSPTYAGYNMPLKVRIWAGSSTCGKKELLAESIPVKHYNWKTYDFVFIPKESHYFIVFEAYYATGKYYAYKGNILLDNCSSFFYCPRAKHEPINYDPLNLSASNGNLEDFEKVN